MHKRAGQGDSMNRGGIYEYDGQQVSGDGCELPELPDRTHGSPYDRGKADSYYSRPRNPHKGSCGAGPRIETLTPNELTEYHLGYNDNETNGEKKEWGI